MEDIFLHILVEYITPAPKHGIEEARNRLKHVVTEFVHYIDTLFSIDVARESIIPYYESACKLIIKNGVTEIDGDLIFYDIPLGEIYRRVPVETQQTLSRYWNTIRECVISVQESENIFAEKLTIFQDIRQVYTHLMSDQFREAWKVINTMCRKPLYYNLFASEEFQSKLDSLYTKRVCEEPYHQKEEGRNIFREILSRMIYTETGFVVERESEELNAWKVSFQNTNERDDLNLSEAELDRLFNRMPPLPYIDMNMFKEEAESMKNPIMGTIDALRSTLNDNVHFSEKLLTVNTVAILGSLTEQIHQLMKAISITREQIFNKKQGQSECSG